MTENDPLYGQVLPTFNQFTPPPTRALGGRVILVGRGGAGKDLLKNRMIARGFVPEVSYTTRPPRLGEVNGKDYHFVTVEAFESMVARGEMHEHVTFNGWLYGTSNANWNNDRLYIKTPSGVRLMSAEDRASSFIIYLDIPREVCLERLKLRADADNAERRALADDADFAGFEDHDLRVTCPTF